MTPPRDSLKDLAARVAELEALVNEIVEGVRRETVRLRTTTETMIERVEDLLRVLGVERRDEPRIQ